MSELQGKVALVTGGGSGIGRASAEALATAGATVVVAGRRREAGEETVRRIRERGGDAMFVQADVTREEDVQRLVTATLDKYGRLDIAFNNAGTEGSPKPLTDATTDEFETLFDANVRGVWLSMKYQIPAMLAAGGGVVINNASIAGSVGMAPAPLYVASKHAVIGLTKSAALAYARAGVRVNSVSPGAIETDMFERFTGGQTARKDSFASAHPVGRVGRAEEVAAAVRWLAAPDASFVTGHDLAVDGGFLAQ